VGGQYLLVQPSANPVLYVTRSETGDKPGGGGEGGSGDSFLEVINNFVPNLPSLPSLPSIPNFPFPPGTGTSETNTTAEQPTEKPGGFDKPEKVSISGSNCRHTEQIIYRKKQPSIRTTNKIK
jgi:hypothetical protein